MPAWAIVVIAFLAILIVALCLLGTNSRDLRTDAEAIADVRRPGAMLVAMFIIGLRRIWKGLRRLVGK